eukprot:118626-Rhodomonas_salina.4
MGSASCSPVLVNQSVLSIAPDASGRLRISVSAYTHREERKREPPTGREKAAQRSEEDHGRVGGEFENKERERAEE